MGDARGGHDEEVELEPAAAPGRHARHLVAVNALIVAAALVAGFLLATRGSGTDERATDPTEPSTAPPSTGAPTVEQLLAILPASPIDGKQSWRLPVAVTPQSGVSDGQVVTVVGRGFGADESVGGVLCASEAAVEGVAACDLGTDGTYDHVTYATSSSDGLVQVDIVLRRSIATPFTGPVDCASAAERCLVALGAVSDYDRSGGSFVAFAGAPPFPEPSLALDPPGPYVPGQPVTVHATGLLAPREVQVEQCRDEQCVVVARGRVAPDGTFDAAVAAQPSFIAAGGTVVVCEDACVLRVSGIGVPGTTSAPNAAAVSLAFTPPDPDGAPPSSLAVTASTVPPTGSVAGTVVASAPPGTTAAG
jgi:hypothetical protein